MKATGSEEFLALGFCDESDGGSPCRFFLERLRRRNLIKFEAFLRAIERSGSGETGTSGERERIVKPENGGRSCGATIVCYWVSRVRGR